jgi:hypothetical protein
MQLEPSKYAVELVNEYLCAIENLMIANNQKRLLSTVDEKREAKKAAREKLINYIAKLEEKNV